MLTDKETHLIHAVRDGRQPEDRTEAAGLIERGYLRENRGTLELTDKVEDDLRLLPSIGEAIADVLIPGAGTAEASQHPVQTTSTPAKPPRGA